MELTIKINEKNQEGKNLLKYLKSLSFIEVIKNSYNKKKEQKFYKEFEIAVNEAKEISKQNTSGKSLKELLDELKNLSMGLSIAQAFQIKRSSLIAEAMLSQSQKAISSLPLWLLHQALGRAVEPAAQVRSGLPSGLLHSSPGTGPVEGP